MKTLPECFQPEAFTGKIASSITRRATGTIDTIVGDRIDVVGLNAAVGSHCRIETTAGTSGIAKVIGFHDVNPVLSAFDQIRGISVGDRVELLSEQPSVGVGAGLLGRVIDALGRPIDGKPLPAALESCPVESDPPKSLDRPPIDAVFETGIRAFDGLLTCGVGQRVGIFAGAGVGKSTLQGMLARSTKADAIVIGLVGNVVAKCASSLNTPLAKQG